MREKFWEIGRRWRVSLRDLVEMAAALDESGEWMLDRSRTCAHWIAEALDVEVCTAREWVRVGRALRTLPVTAGAFADDTLSFTKVRHLTRLATPANEAELVDIAAHVPAGHLSRALAAWSARHEEDDVRDRRHQRERGVRAQPRADGMVEVHCLLTPEQFASLGAVVDARVMHNDATASRASDGTWLSLAQQRADALVSLVTGGGGAVSTEVIFHVRADGCTLDDGTPISADVIGRLVDGAFLRAMIHDAESRPINVSGRHRHFTTRQKRVIKERDRACVDCGGVDLLEYDHVPEFEVTRRTLVEESALRCAGDHRHRHRTGVRGTP